MKTNLILKIMVVAIPIILSIYAATTSYKSNQIAKDAVETTKHHFLQINRPYIILSPKKFDDKQFWKVKQQGDAVEIIVKYEIKNVGNVVAKDIRLPNNVAIGPKLKLEEGAPVIYTRSNKVSLGPGDDFIVESGMKIHYETEEEARKNYEHFLSDKSEGMTIGFSVSYTNGLDESKKYRTLVENKIHNEKATVLKSEMLVLHDND
jgi:hypothetical protein